MWPFGLDDDGGCGAHHFDDEDATATHTINVDLSSGAIIRTYKIPCQHDGCPEHTKELRRTGLIIDDVSAIEEGEAVVVDTETLDEIDELLGDIVDRAEDVDAETAAEIAREMVADVVGDYE